MADQPSEKVVDKQTDKERAVLVAAIDKRLETNSILSDLRQSASTWQLASYGHLSKIERGKPAPNLENVDSGVRSISQERGLDFAGRRAPAQAIWLEA